MQNVKDFDSEFDRKLNLYIEENVGTMVTDINETIRNRIQSVINSGYNDGLSTEKLVMLCVIPFWVLVLIEQI